MSLNFRFAVVSDLHIALPHTIQNQPNRFHLVEVSIPALEVVLEHLEQQQLDFLLLPGDLTQDGEPDNHAWLQKRLSQLPFPVYVVPGNHDIPSATADTSIKPTDFPYYYRKFGYDNPEQLYYTCEVLPGVRLIGLNSNSFDTQGRQEGHLDALQLTWLQEVLTEAKDELVMVMVHHNVVEHLPDQSNHQLARRYMLGNAVQLLQILSNFGVQLVFTGHLHIQDIACSQGVYDITTGSLVSYPHPYRLFQFHGEHGQKRLHISSHRVESLPGWPTLQQMSRQWMGDRSSSFLLKFLTQPPLNLPQAEAEELIPSLRYFWADIAHGDALFEFPNFPPLVRLHLQKFSASTNGAALIDNNTTLLL